MIDTNSVPGVTLDRWSAYPWTDGVQLEHLAPLDRLIVRTRNSTYTVLVLSPVAGEVLVRGGRFFPAFTRARVCGCSLGGACLKLRGIYTGFLLELEHEGRVIITTRIRAVETAPSPPAH